MGFKKLRRRTAGVIEAVLRKGLREGDRPTLTHPATGQVDVIPAGRLPGPDGSVMVWNERVSLVFPRDAVSAIEAGVRDMLRQPSLSRRKREHDVFARFCEEIVANHEGLASGQTTAQEVASKIVDWLESPMPIYEVMTPLLGVVPMSGRLDIGGVTIIRAPPDFGETVYRPGRNEWLRAAGAEPLPPGVQDGFERAHLREYVRHSIAIIATSADEGVVSEVVRLKLDLVVGAIALFVLMAPGEPVPVQIRAMGESWYPATHFLMRWGARVGSQSTAPVAKQPVVVDTERIPVTKNDLFGLVDRVIAAEEPEGTLTVMEQRLRQFLYWFGRAQDSPRNPERLVHSMIAIETLFECEGIRTRHSVSDFVAAYWAVQTHMEEGQRVRCDLLDLYRRRCDIVHRGFGGVNDDEIRRCFFYATCAFWLLSDLIQYGFSTAAQLKGWHDEARRKMGWEEPGPEAA